MGSPFSELQMEEESRIKAPPSPPRQQPTLQTATSWFEKARMSVTKATKSAGAAIEAAIEKSDLENKLKVRARILELAMYGILIYYVFYAHNNENAWDCTFF